MIRPTGDRVTVQPIENQALLPSGLYLPEGAVPKSTKGKVIAVGDAADTTLHGKTVIFSKYAGTEVEDGKDKVLIVNQKDILAIVEESL